MIKKPLNQYICFLILSIIMMPSFAFASNEDLIENDASRPKMPQAMAKEIENARLFGFPKGFFDGPPEGYDFVESFKNHVEKDTRPQEYELHLEYVAPWVLKRTLTPFLKDPSVSFEKRLHWAVHTAGDSPKSSKNAFTQEEIVSVFNRHVISQNPVEIVKQALIDKHILRHHANQVDEGMARACFNRLYSYFTLPHLKGNPVLMDVLLQLIKHPRFEIDQYEKEYLLGLRKSEIRDFGYWGIRCYLLDRQDVSFTLAEMESFLEMTEHRGFFNKDALIREVLRRPDYPIQEKYQEWLEMLENPPLFERDIKTNGGSYFPAYKITQTKIARGLCQYLDLKQTQNRPVICQILQNKNLDLMVRMSGAEGLGGNTSTPFDMRERLEFLKNLADHADYPVLAHNMILGMLKAGSRALTPEEYEVAWFFMPDGVKAAAYIIHTHQGWGRHTPTTLESVERDLMACCGGALLKGTTHPLEKNEQEKFFDIFANCEKLSPASQMVNHWRLYKAMQKRCPLLDFDKVEAVLKSFE